MWLVMSNQYRGAERVLGARADAADAAEGFRTMKQVKLWKKCSIRYTMDYWG